MHLLKLMPGEQLLQRHNLFRGGKATSPTRAIVERGEREIERERRRERQRERKRETEGERKREREGREIDR